MSTGRLFTRSRQQLAPFRHLDKKMFTPPAMSKVQPIQPQVTHRDPDISFEAVLPFLLISLSLTTIGLIAVYIGFSKLFDGSPLKINRVDDSVLARHTLDILDGLAVPAGFLNNASN